MPLSETRPGTARALPPAASPSDRPGPADRPARNRAARPGRVAGLDVARALAVVGMFGAHVGAVRADVDVSPASWSGVVNGRASILFAVLAGLSIALLSGRTTPAAGADLAPPPTPHPAAG